LALQSILSFFLSNNRRHCGPPNSRNIKYATVEDVFASFLHPILPTVQGEPDYQTIRASRKLPQANARTIDTHLGGGELGHLGLIVSHEVNSIIAKTGEIDQYFELTQQPQGGHRQFWIREQRHRSAQSDTLGSKPSSPTVHSTRCNKRSRNKSSLFLSQCTWTFCITTWYALQTSQPRK
jgi:hypothetical protein